jgi:cytochrome c biogenesis protein CcmG/thiol:disulfide interchange protein DsbE
MNSPRGWLRVRPRTRVLVALSLAGVVFIGGLFLFRADGAPKSSTSNGTAIETGFRQMNISAPQFDLPVLQDAGQVSLRQLAGRPIVMNLWSSSCDICKEESPAIAQVSRAAGGKVYFLGVDTLDERASAVKFASRYELSFPIAYDSSGIVASEYRVIGLPYTFFISESGTRVLGVNIGALSAQKLVYILHKLYGLRMSVGRMLHA